MTSDELVKKIRCGETSRVQFKQHFTTQKEMAAELVAFANCEGGDLTIRASSGRAASWPTPPTSRCAPPSTCRPTWWRWTAR